MEKSRRINTRSILLAISVLVLAVSLVLLCIRPTTNPELNADPTGTDATQETQSALPITELLDAVKAIKSNLMSALQDIKQDNLESARNRLDTARKDIAAVRAFMDKIPFLMHLIPKGDSIQALVEAADMAIPEILLPAVDLLETHPLSALSVGDGYDMTLLYAYIDFAESVMPKLEKLVEAANSIDLSLFDSEGKLTEYLTTANGLLDTYHKNPAVLSMFKTMLGAQEDRLYLIAVQNPSEIRASGGFPGSMGILRIEDGILTLGNFETVTNFLTWGTPNNIQITQEEYALFSYLSGIQAPRDADLCPDFERVGHIWASSYEQRHHESVSGVISATPHIVQRLLAAMDGEIELFDGLVLNGDNATRVLIHDIYFKYFNRQHPIPDGETVSDQLFADAAQKTMKALTGNISVSRLLAYLPVMKESIADRTLMLWMKDEQEQAFMIDRGWSGGLNKDPQIPEAGIYFNGIVPSKMGWFLLMDAEIGERTKNADGSYSYPITVTFSNNITKEEISAASYYISAGYGGAIRGAAYFFAPAGGSVDNFTTSNGQRITLKTYNGMTLGFMDQFSISPDTPITVTYTVTTAPGVDTPLVISQTPTAQQP